MIFSITESGKYRTESDPSAKNGWMHWLLFRYDSPAVCVFADGLVNVRRPQSIGIPRGGCTCPPACDFTCKGECGCQACNDAYQDFLTMYYD